MDVMLNKPARGANSTDQNMVRRIIIAVIDQDLVILLDRERYVFRHITSEGAGAGFANSLIGLGSSIAWAAIC
jgi:hypothetical protein